MPKLDIELFYFFGKINLYANLNPRANLVRSKCQRHSLLTSAPIPQKYDGSP